MNKSFKINENGLEYLVVQSFKRDKDSGEMKLQKEKKYCLEVNTSKWKPTYPGEICPEYMLAYCQAQGLDALKWYVGILEEKIIKTKENKTTKEVIQTVERRRTPSEVKQAFIKRFFPDMKRVKDEEYKGHTSRAKEELAKMMAAAANQPTKKAAPKAEQPKE
jgi:hypothetical protein